MRASARAYLFLTQHAGPARDCTAQAQCAAALPDSPAAAQAAKDSIDGSIAELEATFKQDDAAAESAAQHAFDEVSNHMSLVMAEIQAAEQQYRATLQGLWGAYKEHHSRLVTIKQARAASLLALGLEGLYMLYSPGCLTHFILPA